MTIQDAKKWIAVINDNVLENKAYLGELDSLMGDGDLGLTITKGFAAAKEYADQSEETDIGKFFIRVGMAFLKAVPSTMGTLIASAFIAAGKAVVSSTELTEKNFCTFTKGFCNGVMDRGHCKPGDRTIVDVLYAASEAAEKAAIEAKSIQEIISAVNQASQEALEKTKTMFPTTGKALYHSDKAIGKPDQGAVVGMIIYKSLSQV